MVAAASGGLISISGARAFYLPRLAFGLVRNLTLPRQIITVHESSMHPLPEILLGTSRARAGSGRNILISILFRKTKPSLSATFTELGFKRLEIT